MIDYKNSKVAQPLMAGDLMAGLCFGLVFYGFIFLILAI